MDYAKLIFILLDAIVGLMALLKDNVRGNVEKAFTPAWIELRKLQKAVDKSVSQLEKKHAVSNTDETFAKTADFVVLAVKAKIAAEAQGKGEELNNHLKSFL